MFTPRETGSVVGLILIAALGVGTVGALEPPRPSGAQLGVLQARDLPGAVDELRQGVHDRAWLGYAVPMLEGDHHVCCTHGGAFGEREFCPLDGWSSISIISEDRPLMSGAPQGLAVFLRIENGGVTGVRVFDGSCAVNAGGDPFYGLRDVDEAASVRLLSSLAQSGDERALDLFEEILLD
jgi:hypothetical protein